MQRCPTESTLRRLAAAGSDDTTFSAIEQHVESCPMCRELMQSIVDNDLLRPPVPLLGSDRFPQIPGFRVERELGRSLNAAVFLARDTALNRQVAIKIVETGHARAEAEGSLCITEEQAVARLRHPNIVQLYHVLQVGQLTVLVLEYVPGGSLKNRLIPAAPLAPFEAARILETLARAVGYVHNSKLVHLDIKPSNILVDGETGCPLDPAKLKISDFGISVPLTSPNARIPVRGTPAYMAPEQASGCNGAIGPAADIYALGALLYHLLTGGPPFPSSSIAKTRELIATVEPAPPRNLNPRIPKDLEAICLHCLQKLPEKRYASAEALADDLRRFLDGLPIAVRPISTFDRFGRWCRRRPVPAALVIALALTIIASISGLAVLLNRSESDRTKAVTARNRAEENEAMASRTLEELEAWIHQVLIDPTVLQTDFDPTLIDGARILTENLHGDDESVLRMTGTVSVLQRHLAARIFGRPGRRSADAAGVLARSRRHLRDCLRWKPDAEVVRNEYMQTLLFSASVASEQDSFDEADGYFRELIALLPVLRHEIRLVSLLGISKARRDIAISLTIAGKRDDARRLLAANLSMLEGVSPADAVVPDVRLERAMTLTALGTSTEVVSELRDLKDLLTERTAHEGGDTWVASIVPDPKSGPPSEWRRLYSGQEQLRSWLGRRVVDAVLWEPGDSGTEDAAGLEKQGKAMVDSIHQEAQAIGIGHPDIPAIALQVGGEIVRGCAAERRWERVDPSRDSAKRFLAFAEQVARAYPDRAQSHFLVSEGHFQVSKNAWYFDDKQGAVEALRRAVAAMRHAADLDPQWPSAQREAAERERRLKKAEANSHAS
jgi:serine/threonine protein kinase